MGEVVLPAIEPASSQVLVLPWTPPSSADFALVADGRAHVCLVARVIEDRDDLGLAVPEGPWLSTNVLNNNNIAWRNVTVIRPDAGGLAASSFLLGHLGPDAACFNLRFDDGWHDGQVALFQPDRLWVTLPPDLLARWQQQGAKAINMSPLPDGRLRVEQLPAELRGLCLQPGDMLPVTIEVVPRATPRPGPRVLRIEQFEQHGQGNPGASRPVGGLVIGLPGPR